MANWDKLVAVLDQTVELYQAILDISRRKREILIAVKPQELEALTKQEEALILQVGKLEATRGKLAGELAAASGVSADGLTLAAMQQLAGPAVADRLGKIAGELARIMEELAPVNQLNAELIQRALGYINYNINLLTRSTAGPTYAPRGKGNNEAQIRKLVDRKI